MSKVNSKVIKAKNTKDANGGALADLIKRNRELQKEISELKKDKLELHKFKDGFHLLMERTPDLLFINDAKGNIIDANHIACKTLGYKREELLQLSIRDIEERIAEHQEKLKESMHSAPVTFDGMQKRKDGTLFPVEIRLWPFESGGQKLMLALARDVSERRRRDEETKKHEDQQNFLKKMQSIGTLAGGIAHNFNNILMGIQGNVSLMTFDKKPEDRDYARLNKIQDLIDNGARLTNQLIGYAREGAYYLKDGNLNQIVSETLDFYFKHVMDISVRTELAEDLLSVRVDKTQIGHVLMDLYSNAVDAMPDGGNIIIKTKNIAHTDIKGKGYQPAPGRYVMLSVKDSGTGMSADVISRIFEPFFTTKGLAKGSGLGLASVYGIIKGHQGYIEVESEPGRGTVFSIYLPAIERQQEQKEEVTGRFYRGEETILLVDDDTMVLDTGEEILARLGYRVISASGGGEAIKLFMEHHARIDAVLLDMIMPDTGGGEVFDRIKEINPEIKVLLTSGYSRDGEADEILKRGCDGFIQKPFHIKELSKRLREILEKK
ncbi:MAG: response regulator [Deltaproteobacteria bacterium]|nr:response regulator [Deltaproteobacteria bacterium]